MVDEEVTHVVCESSASVVVNTTTRKAQQHQPSPPARSAQFYPLQQQDDFDRAAVRLVEVLFSLRELDPPFFSWTVQRMGRVVLPACRGEAGIFLEHPPLIRSILPSKRTMRPESLDTTTCCSAASSSSGDCGDSNVLDAEQTLLWNDPEAYTSPSTIPVADETVWNLSIVYSDTWQVPVLYFRVEWCTNGQPCTRAEIVQLVRSGMHQPPEHNNDNDEGLPEEFVSATEHPVHGTPCYFLHPCQTAERLRTITCCQHADGETEPWNMEATTSRSGKDHALQLWSWCSLLLPALGFSIPPRLFLRVQNQLDQTTK